MKNETHRRMAGDYEIIQATHIGGREIILGGKIQDESVEKYICAFYQQNELFAVYGEAICNDNYAEIIRTLGGRVTERAEKIRVATSKPKIQGTDDHPIAASDCTVVSYEDDLNNKTVVIKPEVPCRGHRRTTCQLGLCTGGFDVYPRSRGPACFYIDLHTGKEGRYKRMDILGIMEPEKLPGWTKYGLLAVQQERAKKGQRKGEKKAQ